MHQSVVDAAHLARTLSSAPTQAEIWRQLKAFGAAHGFHHLTVLKGNASLPVRIAPSIAYIDAPIGYAENFDREHFGPHHPLITRALSRSEPFSVTEAHATQLTPAQRRVLQYVSVSLNVRDGWTFPIVCCGTSRGIVMLGGPNPDMSPLTSSLLHLLVHGAFRRSEELAKGGAAKSHALTAREAECLRWVAQGKTDLEIGLILSISARTARFHVENVKRKLRVATRVQAVAEALRLHAIAA